MDQYWSTCGNLWAGRITYEGPSPAQKGWGSKLMPEGISLAPHTTKVVSYSWKHGLAELEK